MYRAARGSSPSAARISATRLCRLASETNVSGHRRSRSSDFATASGRRSRSNSSSWKAFGESGVGRPWRRSTRRPESNSQSPKTTRMEAVKELEFHENSARTARSAGAYIGTGRPLHAIANSRRAALGCCQLGSARNSRRPPRRPARRSGSVVITRSRNTCRTAECVSMEVRCQYRARCTLPPGGPVARMAWRPLPPGVHRGFRESYKTEIAAYELDKLLKLDMVPPDRGTSTPRQHRRGPAVGGERRRCDGPRVASRVESAPIGRANSCG